MSAHEHSFESVHINGGEIYGSRGGVIVKVFGSDDDSAIDYEGTMSFASAETKHIEAIKFTGLGTATVRVSQIEDTDVSDTEGEVDMDSVSDQDRMVYPPAWLYTAALRYRISGKPTIRAMMVEVISASTER